jgi:hypothetical protein
MIEVHDTLTLRVLATARPNDMVRHVEWGNQVHLGCITNDETTPRNWTWEDVNDKQCEGAYIVWDPSAEPTPSAALRYTSYPVDICHVCKRMVRA